MGQRREELIQRAKVLPELLRRAERHPVALKAQGARIFDVDNFGYIDYTGGRGAAICGYANQYILDAVRKVLTSGIPDGLHVPQEVELAETLAQFLPWVGNWWFCRNQGEALRMVLRWARRNSGNDLLLFVDGGAPLRRRQYPIWSDDDASTVVRMVPGWDLDRIEVALTAGASKLAAFVVDPLMTRIGCAPAPEGVLERIAEICRDLGILLVVDERVSGFRVHRGGACEGAGIVPDVAIFGGALGGAFPIGVAAFREGIDRPELGEDGMLPAPHAVSLAAAEAVLSILKNQTTYERLEERTKQLEDGVLALAERFSRPISINRVGSVFALYLGEGPVRDVSSAEATDQAAYRRLVTALAQEGVLLPPDPCRPAFLSNAHGAKDVEETLAAFESVLMRLYQEDLP
ncbi:MAG: aminotransferase class III-fold pyridoxal phosphate-dependent enzyme [bacterium]|nr:aminotransferase class III-fold pyridoxal phosphate-dependent enzyme [bacterium]